MPTLSQSFGFAIWRFSWSIPLGAAFSA